jgi:hypothetical protein
VNHSIIFRSYGVNQIGALGYEYFIPTGRRNISSLRDEGIFHPYGTKEYFIPTGRRPLFSAALLSRTAATL